MPIRLRDATSDDDESIRQVQKETWLSTYPNAEHGITSADIIAMFDDLSEEAQRRATARKQSINASPKAHLWVAEDDSRIVGFCLASKNDQEHRVSALYVLSAYQGKGIGKQLMQAALDWLGATLPIILMVASYNDRAIGFYQQFGFAISTASAQQEISRIKLPSGVFIPEREMVKSVAPTEG